MVLNNDGTMLFIGYGSTKEVVAYSVSTCQQMWKSTCEGDIFCMSYHAGTVLVGVLRQDFFMLVLNAANGKVLRELDIRGALGFAVIRGLFSLVRHGSCLAYWWIFLSQPLYFVLIINYQIGSYLLPISLFDSTSERRTWAIISQLSRKTRV
jgi:hypothetical protein